MVGLSQSVLQSLETGIIYGLADDIAGEVAEQTIKLLVPELTSSLLEGGLMVLHAGYSIIEEYAEELFLDKLIGSMIEDVVENLGGDDAAKVFWSTLGESFREGGMGIILGGWSISLIT